MRGVYTALITPFDSNNEIDLGAYVRIIRDQREAGITGVIPCGTTGESPTLSLAEKKLLIQACVDELKGSGVKVVAGTGSNSTPQTVEFSRWASEAGVDGVLVVTPYYNKPSPAGLEAHFTAIADAVRCDVMLYNVPGRTGVSLSAATVTRLAAHPRITTIKEATGNVEFSSQLLDALTAQGRKMDVLSGDDATFLPLLSIGAVGVVSVASNLFPRAMVALHRAQETGRNAEACALHQRFYPLFRDLFIESNPVPIKTAMSLVGWCGAQVRAPLAPLAPANLETLKASLDRCGVITGSRL
ncbi:MAG: 4-hydroxy-tetrahydrodipicolinate synthase [Oligoflexia bacterium]|nr:4-hydroxy-tetrahydrodipicolinate synthase [Oligoflexia bacterium]